MMIDNKKGDLKRDLPLIPTNKIIRLKSPLFKSYWQVICLLVCIEVVVVEIYFNPNIIAVYIVAHIA